METEYQKIMRKTHRKTTSCKCGDCKKHCQTAVCLGTPQDIEKIIDAGFKDRLIIKKWHFDTITGNSNDLVAMCQPKFIEGKGCAFFEDGLCTLHNAGLKPTEGKLGHHSKKEDSQSWNKSLVGVIAKTWTTYANEGHIDRIITRMKQPLQ